MNNLPPPPPNQQLNTHSHKSSHLSDNANWDFSSKIVVLSFAMSVMIVYLHSKFLYTGETTLNEVHKFIVAILNTCVPTFFAISSYLFFRNFEFSQLKDKLKRRIKSLLIPYLIWNVAYVLFMVTLSYAGLTSFYLDLTIVNVTRAILNAECSPLWFVRYLIYFVMLAPVTYLLFRNSIVGAAAIVIILTCNYFNYISGNLGTQLNVNANTLAMLNYQYAYYALGAYCALNYNKNVENVKKSMSIVGLGFLIILIGIYWVYLNSFGNIASFHLFRFLWIPSLWFAVDTFPTVKTRTWMKFSFFIYCSHMFLIYCSQGVIEMVYSRMGIYKLIFACIEYISLGSIVVYILINIARYWKKKYLSSYKLVSGSRG